MHRRAFLTLFGGVASAAPTPDAPVAILQPLPRPLARFTAGVAGSFDLADHLARYKPGITRLRLRANVGPTGGAAEPFVSFSSQFPEYRLDGSVLRFDGGAGPAMAPGASAVRLRFEASDQGFDDTRSGVAVSDMAVIQVDAPLARIRHGLDAWDGFDALSRAVQGDAAPGTAPRGRVDLIGQTFEITPGMLSEAIEGGARPAPVAVIQFPCTVTAMDPRRRPVLRSVSGERDIVQIQATALPPIDGEVVLRDLVIRDNRAWYNSGEAGVRIKDRFAGRSVRIERCEFIRCQNAVSGGAPGQTLRILDCRIVDCGVGDQAHGLYVSPEWLEFFGNVVMQSPGNRLARAHLLKTRALNASILGNRFDMNDCPGSYLIDLSNGGDIEIGGNLLRYGPASDNDSATLVAYAPEGVRGDSAGGELRFAPGRRFRLVARNNTLISGFPGRSRCFVVDRHAGLRAEGGTVFTAPEPLTVEDNLVWCRGPGSLVIRRDRTEGRAPEVDASGDFAANTLLTAPTRTPRVANSGGTYPSRRFTGTTYLGTGSEPYAFTTRGAN